jgi:hypothetical protein
MSSGVDKALCISNSTDGIAILDIFCKGLLIWYIFKTENGQKMVANIQTEYLKQSRFLGDDRT